MIAAQKIPAHVLHGPEFDLFRDRIREQADLSKTNWFRVGGPAEFLFKPADTQDLAAFLKLLPYEVPVTVLGIGSNVIIRDGGIDGVVIKLGRFFAEIKVDANRIEAGGSAPSMNVAMVACEHGLKGFEFLSGIPGTIGGAVRMNAGAYSSETSSILLEAEIVERDGMIRKLRNEELAFTYRNSRIADGTIVTRAWFRGEVGNKEEIAQKMALIAESRKETQPIRTATGGSTFKNPPGKKAWELIDQAGCRGLTIGGAQVSELHCNFLINTGNATAKDLENLGEEVRKRVKEKTGVQLEWEIKRIGKNK